MSTGSAFGANLSNILVKIRRLFTPIRPLKACWLLRAERDDIGDQTTKQML